MVVCEIPPPHHRWCLPLVFSCTRGQKVNHLPQASLPRTGRKEMWCVCYRILSKFDKSSRVQKGWKKKAWEEAVPPLFPMSHDVTLFFLFYWFVPRCAAAYFNHHHLSTEGKRRGFSGLSPAGGCRENERLMDKGLVIV